jgi:hypothetical protein
MPSDPNPVATMERLLRPTALLAETIAAALGVGLLPKAAAARFRR